MGVLVLLTFNSLGILQGFCLNFFGVPTIEDMYMISSLTAQGIFVLLSFSVVGAIALMTTKNYESLLSQVTFIRNIKEVNKKSLVSYLIFLSVFVLSIMFVFFVFGDLFSTWSNDLLSRLAVVEGIVIALMVFCYAHALIRGSDFAEKLRK